MSTEIGNDPHVPTTETGTFRTYLVHVPFCLCSPFSTGPLFALFGKSVLPSGRITPFGEESRRGHVHVVGPR